MIRVQPKGFWPKRIEGVTKLSISAESRKEPKANRKIWMKPEEGTYFGSFGQNRFQNAAKKVPKGTKRRLLSPKTFLQKLSFCQNANICRYINAPKETKIEV